MSTSAAIFDRIADTMKISTSQNVNKPKIELTDNELLRTVDRYERTREAERGEPVSGQRCHISLFILELAPLRI